MENESKNYNEEDLLKAIKLARISNRDPKTTESFVHSDEEILDLIKKSKPKKIEWKKINERVDYIVSLLKKNKVNFDNIEFTGDNQKYFITGVKADKGHEELKVYYKWENEGTEYEVDFFDFHNEYFEKLLVLIESQLFILGF